MDTRPLRSRGIPDSCILNRCRHLNVAQASGGGLDIRDQVGRVPIARLGQVDLVADPAGIALPGVANVRIIGRVKALAGWSAGSRQRTWP